MMPQLTQNEKDLIDMHVNTITQLELALAGGIPLKDISEYLRHVRNHIQGFKNGKNVVTKK